jgi:hypothetical protein
MLSASEQVLQLSGWLVQVAGLQHSLDFVSYRRRRICAESRDVPKYL